MDTRIIPTLASVLLVFSISWFIYAWNTYQPLYPPLIAFLTGLIVLTNYLKDLPERTSPIVRAYNQNPRYVALAIIFIFIIIFSLYLLLDRNIPVSYVEISDDEKKSLVGYSQNGMTVWKATFNSSITKAILDDIDGDEIKEVLVGTKKPGTGPGLLFVLDSATGNTLKGYKAWKPTIYHGSSSSQFDISDFQVDDLYGDGRKEIVIVAKDVYWYASLLSVISFDEKKQFKEIASYWNPGSLLNVYVEDLNNDKIKEIICTGINNDLQQILPLGSNVHVVFALNSTNILGQAPPYFGNYPQGTELWYCYVLNSKIRETRITAIDFIDSDSHNLAKNVHVTAEDGCSWYLDHGGNNTKWGIGSACKGDSILIKFEKKVVNEGVSEVEMRMNSFGIIQNTSSLNEGDQASKFKVSEKTYGESTDLNKAIKNEFGANYRLADWEDIKAYSSDIESWANSIGMKHGDYYFVSRNGQDFWGTSSRHYFITRFDGVVDSNYQIHDQIDNNSITLGSWFGIQERILAIREPN